MASRDHLTLEAALAAFDEHLRRARGLCAGTRVNYARFVRAFLQAVFADGPVEIERLHPRDVVGFVAGLTHRYRPRTVELGASALPWVKPPRFTAADVPAPAKASINVGSSKLLTLSVPPLQLNATAPPVALPTPMVIRPPPLVTLSVPPFRL